MDGEKIVSIRPQGRFKADNGAALVAASLAGLGLACLPISLVREHLESGALVPVMARYAVPSCSVYVVRPPAQHPNRKVRMLTDLLVEHFKEFSTAAQPLGSRQECRCTDERKVISA